MFRNNPRVRLALYAATLVALGIVSALNVAHIIDPALAGQLSTGINTVAGILGVSAAGVAAVTLGRQQADGTLVISGSPDEQLSQAAQRYAEATAAARANVANAEAVLTQVLSTLPGGATVAGAVTGAVDTAIDNVGDVVVACGDALR